MPAVTSPTANLDINEIANPLGVITGPEGDYDTSHQVYNIVRSYKSKEYPLINQIKNS